MDDIHHSGQTSEFISSKDAASMYRVTHDHISRLCRQGKIRGVLQAGVWLVEKNSVREFFSSKRKENPKAKNTTPTPSPDMLVYYVREEPAPVPEAPVAVVSTPAPAPQASLPKFVPTVPEWVKRARASRAQAQDISVQAQSAAEPVTAADPPTREAVLVAENTPGAASVMPLIRAHHTPTHIKVRSLETLLHKTLTVALVFMLTLGTYAAVDPEYALRAGQSIRQELASVMDSYREFGSMNTASGLVAAASSPSTLWGSVSGTIVSIVQGITSSFDRLAYSIMFPPGATDSIATVDTTSGAVSVNITPYQGGVRPVVQKVSEPAKAPVVTKAPAPVVTPASTPDRAMTAPVPQIINNTYPVIERIVEKQTLASAGGLTQEVLDQKLQILDNKLTAQILAHSNANSTAISQNYTVITQSNAIHNLDNVTVGNPTITGGSISGTSIAATSLSISGSATTTSGGGFDIASGCFSVNGTCISGTGGSGTVTSITAGAGLSGGVITTSGTLALDYASSSIWTAASSTYTGHLSLNTASSSIFTSTTLCLTGDTCRTTWPTGGGGAWSWNVATNYGTSTNATTTPTWFQTGLFASSTSQFVNASSSQQTIAGTLWLPVITSALLSTNASGQVVATTSIGTNLLTGVLAIGNGGTGTSTAPTYGRLLMGNSGGTFDYVSTTSLGINSAVWGSITGTLSNQTDLQNALDTKLSLTTWYATTTDGLDEGSTNRYFTDARVQAYLDAVSKGFFFSTTSTDYWKSQTTFTGASTTLLANNNTWTGLNTFGNSSTSLATISGTTWFTNGSLNSALLSTNASGQLVATTTIGTNLLTGALTTINGTTINAAGTHTITAASSSLLGDNNTFSGTNTFSSTISGSISGNAGTVGNMTAAQLIAAGFSTTSADHWKSLNNFFSTTSVAYWEGTQTRWATTSASYFLSQNQGLAFSTTSVDYWKTQTSFTGASTTLLSDNNTFSGNTTFTNATTSSFAITNLSHSILSVNANGSVVATTSIGWNLIKGPASSLFAFDASGNPTATTSIGTNYLVGPANAILSTNSSGAVVATTSIGVNYLSGTLSTTNGGTGTSTPASYGNLLAWNGSNYQGFATSTLGLPVFSDLSSYVLATRAINTTYPLQGGGDLSADRTLTLAFGTTTSNTWAGTQTFSNPIVVGGTGTSTFAGNIGITGNIIPSVNNTYSLGSSAFMWKDVFIGPGSLYVNGKKVIEDVANVITISTDPDQNLMTQTSGVGNSTMRATGSGNVGLLTGSGNINITSTSGNINIGTSGSGQLNLGTITQGVWTGTAINTSYVTGALGTINGTTFNRGDTLVVSSTTLLANNNTFSGSNIFSSPLSLSSTSGTTTIAAGQGFTIGSSQFVLQQGSGRVGIGTDAPAYTLDVTGTGRFTSTLALGTVTTCTGGQALQTDGSGNISCGTITVGGTSTGGGWTTNNIGRVSLATTTDLAVVGASTTPYAKFSILSGAAATTTLVLSAAASQTANLIDIYDANGTLSTVLTSDGKLGLGNSAPSEKLNVQGAVAAQYFSATSSTASTFTGGLISQASSTFSALLNLAQSTTSLATFTNNTWFTGIAASSLLSLDENQKLVATTSIGTNLITGLLGTVNGTAFNRGDSITVAAASSTLLANNNTWTGLNTFGNSSTSLATISGTTWFTNGSLNNALLSTNASGQLVATTSIGTNLLTGALTTINGTTINAAGTHTITAASSSLLGDNNTWSGTNVFSGNATFTRATTTSFAISSITNSILSTNANGSVVASTSIGWNLIKGPASSIFAFDASGNPTATTSIGTNYITGALGTINGTTFSRGDSITISAASSTLLIDNNTFSGTNIFSSPLSLSSTSGTTTIATGQGFTIGGSQFVLQQGSGNVGIGTTTPGSLLHVYGGSSGGTTGSGSFTIEDDTSVFLQLMTPAGNNQEQIRFGDADNSGAGLIGYHHIDDRMTFYTAATERLRITSVGNLGIGNTAPSEKLNVQGVIAGQSLLATSSAMTSLFTGGLSVTGTTTLTTATTTAFAITSLTNSILSTNANGSVVASTTIGWNLLKGPASSIFAFDASGNPTATTSIGTNYLIGPANAILSTNSSGAVVATTSIGVNYLSGILGIANGGTATSTQVTNGVNFFDGTRITSGTALTFDGTNLGIGTTSPGSLLSVAGNAYASGYYNTSGTTGGYQIDGNLILQASSTLNSFFIGQSAGNASTTGVQNYGLGTFALSAITTGDANNAMGRAAMNALTTGSSNAAIGNEALRLNTTGSDNVAIGASALRLNVSATSSVAVGSSAGNNSANFSNQGGTYVGYFAGFGAQTNSDFNTLFGYQAGRGITTGSNNIWIGTATSSAAIANLTTGSQNILIGNNISLRSATASGQLNIGNIIYGTGITGTGSTVSTGNIAIGTTTPYSRFTTWGTGSLFEAVTNSSSTVFSIGQNGATSTSFAATTICFTGDTCRTTWPTSGSSWPFTTGLTNFGTSTQATTTVLWAQMGLHASSTSQLASANIWNTLSLKATSSALLATDANGMVIATTSVGTNYLIGPANAILSTNSSGSVVATTSIGTNYLTGILAIANGGTNNSSGGTTNGVMYFDGTKMTSDGGLTYTPSSSFFVNDLATLASGLTSQGLSTFDGNIVANASSTFAAQMNIAQSSTTLATLSGTGTWFSDLTNSLLSTDANGKLTATTSIGVNYLSGILPVANGGTATGTQVTNGVNFFDGTRITSGTALTFDGSKLGIGDTSPSYSLDVNGFINTDGTTGGYKQAGNTILYASSTTQTLGLGEGAGGSWIISTSTSGLRSVAIGYQALNTSPTTQANLTVDNTAVGYQALKSTTVVGNTAVGAQALTANSSGVLNVAMGQWSQISNTTGNRNTSVGAQNLYRNITGSNNVALGTYASYYNGSATNTVAIGYASAYGNGSLYNNQGGTAIGYQSGYSLATDSDYNTLLGYQAGYGITTGSNNIWIGTATSSTGIANLTTGSQNILIGNNISLPSATASGQLNIGNIIFGTGITGTGSTLSTGSIGIGTTTPGANLVVNGTTGQNLLQVATSTNQSILVMDQNGNIGLGTTALIGNQGVRLVVDVDDATAYTSSGSLPSAKLSVSNQSNTANTSALMYFNALDGAGFNNMWFSGVAESATAFGGPFVIGNRSSASVYSERFRITSSGNVGIGDTTPSYSLDVNGFINVDGTAGGYKMAGNTILYASSTNQNTLVGQAGATLQTSGTGQFNTAVGYLALSSATSTNSNTAIGRNVLSSVVQGGDANTAVGRDAMAVNTTGTLNSALGYFALNANTTGSSNSAFGRNALSANTTGGSNVAFGATSLLANITGSNNVIAGVTAFLNATSSSNNTAVGFNTGRSVSGATGAVGGTNSFFGYQAGYDVTTGSNNTILGQFTTTGSGITTGSNNILIGQGVRAGLSQTGSNQLNIGNLVFGSGLGSDATLATGNIGIGTTTPYSKLTTWGTGSLFEAVTNSSSTVFSIGQNGATTTSFAISNITNSLLSTNANGSVVATTSIGWNLIKGPASSIFAFDASGNPTATTSIGVNYLSGILPIANGGTATGTQVTNGVNYFDGTRITSGTSLTFNGTTLGTPLFSSTQTSGTSTIASGQGFTIGSTQLVLQQGSGNVGIGATALGTSRLRISSNGAFNDKVLEVTAAGVAGGQTGPFYGGYFSVVSNNSSTAGYGLYAQASGGGGGNKYGVYGSAGVASSNVYSYGVYGLGSYNSGAVGSAGIGLYGDATTTGSSMIATTYGAYITNSTSFGANAYGAYINAGTGATNPIPLAVASDGVEAFRVASTGNVGIGTTSPQERLTVMGGNIYQTGGSGNSGQQYTFSNLGGVDLGAAVGGATGGQNIFVVGNTAYLVTAAIAGTCSSADQTGCEFRIFDVATGTPRFLGGVDTAILTSGVTVAGQYAYIVNGTIAGTCNSTTATGCEFRIYDVSAPTSPVFKGGLDFAQQANSVAISGRYAYVTISSVAGNDFRIIDISDPTNPVTVGGIDLGASGFGLRVQGNYAYITKATSAGDDFVIADISNPAAPFIVGGMDLGTTGYGLDVSGNYAYVGKANGGVTGEFNIYDISNPTAIATTSELNLGTNLYSLTVSGRYAYLGLGSISGDDVRVYDIADPYNPVYIGGVNTGITVQGVSVSGRRLFAGFGNVAGNDFQVYDITGADVQSLTAGTLDAGTLNLRNDLLSQGGIFADAVNAGNGGIYSSGGIFSYVASSTAANPVAGAFMGGSVGIGTTTPWGKLSLAGTAGQTNPLFVIASSTGTSLFSIAGDTGLATFGGGFLSTGSSTITSGLFSANGGASTTNFTATGLTILGNATTTNLFSTTASSTNLFSQLASIGTLTLPKLTHSLLSTDANGVVSATTSIGVNYLSGILPVANGGTATSTQVTNGVNYFDGTRITSGTALTFDGSKLGIGDTTPSYSLDVNGFINTDGTTGGYKMAGNTILYASSTNSSTLLGINAAPSLLSTALYNTALGREAMQNATSTNYNTAVGYRALKGGSSDSSGSSNTAVGFQALQNVTTGSSNAGFGYNALGGNQTGVGNAAFGASALAAVTTGGQNSAVGNVALQSNVSGTSNTAIGSSAQNRNLTGSSNVAIGASALYWNQSATNSVAVGFGALNGLSNYSSQGSVGVGYLAGYASETGSDFNTLIGYQAGRTVTTGQYNTILGYSGTTGGVTSGSNNIIIGKDVRAGLTVTSDNQLNIGNLIFGTGLGSGTTLGTGNVGIGTTSPGSILEVGNSNTSAVLANVTNSNSGAGAYTELGVRNGYTAANNADALRLLTFGTGFTTTGGFVQDGAALEAGANLAGGLSITSRNAAGVIRLYTGGQADSNERMRITSAGRVGIGSTSPMALLTVAGTGNSGVNIGDYFGSGYGAISLNGTADGTNYNFLSGNSVTDNSLYINRTSGGAIHFREANGTSQMTIATGGNVGIGTTSPSSALSVNGFVNVDGITGGYKQDSNTVLYASTTNSALAVGASSAAGWMSASSTVWRSVAVGSGALATTPVSGGAINNAALGYNALNANTTGNDNTASGYLALSANTTGFQNVANGSNALAANTTGFQNVAVGGSALKANTTGGSNTANGYFALGANITGSSNVVIGSAALLNATSSDGTTAIGTLAGRFISGATGASGSYNTLFGYQSGYGITTGARNVLLGQSTIAASYNQVTTGSNNIAIGNDVAVPSATASNQLVIGNLIYGTGLSGTGATVSTGNIGIGTTTPNWKTTISNSSGPQLALTDGSLTSNQWTMRNAGGQLFFATSTYTATSSVSALRIDANGNLIVHGSSGADCTIGNGTSATNCSSSDERLKDNISTLTATSGLSAIKRLNPVSFYWNAGMVANNAPTSTQFGFIAQQVKDVFPNLVEMHASGRYTLDYQGLFAPIVTAIQELSTEVTYVASSTEAIAGATTTPLELTTASSSVSTTTPWIASFSLVPQWLKDGINGIADPLVHVFKNTVYAATGIFDAVFAKDIYATNITADNVTAKQKLCVGITCVTEAQLQALLAGAAASTGTDSGSGSTDDTGTSTPDTGTAPAGDTSFDSAQDEEAPIITVSGNNPATIDVGATYADLGATVTDNVDTNLGIKASVDGGVEIELSAITLDTSTAGTHTIKYKAIDNAGNVGTATRTVVVNDPAATTLTAEEPTPEPVPVSEPAPQPAPETTSTNTIVSSTDMSTSTATSTTP